MRRLYDVKVFDMRNPNCTIGNSIENVCDLLYQDVPVVLNIENTNGRIDFNNMKIVGLATTPYAVNEHEIYADVVIWDSELELEGKYVNYEVSGYTDDNDKFVVDRVECVQIK